jgi:predicted alpha/beta hydrolase family esterase
MAKIHFLSIHGFRGNPDLDYHKYLQQNLGKLGYEVEIPKLPNPENPNEADQIEAVLQQCHLDEDTIIIAHSLGCAVAMKLLMGLPFGVKGLLLVAPVVEPPFCIPEHKGLAYWDGFTFDYDYELIRSKAERRTILSDLSEYEVRGEYCKYLSGKIGAELKEVTARRRHLTGYEESEVLAAAKLFLV